MRHVIILLILAMAYTVSAQEICNNGVDDDGDGMVDCEDPDCVINGSIFPIIENFDGGTYDNPSWVSSGSAYINNGWLTLTDDLGGQSGSAYLDTAFASSNHIIVEFDYATVNYNGDNCFYGIGDGLSFYLTNGWASPSTGEPGAALGYSHGTSGNPAAGVIGGFIGIGLDEFGSFSGTNAAPSTCVELGTDAVTIRGEQTGNDLTAYSCLGTTLLPGNADVDVASRDEARRVRILLTPGGVLDIYIDLNDGNGLQPVFENLATGQIVPAIFKLGFSASTGGACIAHEIDNIVVGKPADIEVRMDAPASSNICDGIIEYTITAINHGPNDVSQVYLQDQLPVDITNINWSCDECIPTTGGGSSLVNAEVNLLVGDTVVLNISGVIGEGAVNSTITNTAGIDFACTDFISSDINNSMSEASTSVTESPINIDLGTDTGVCSFPLILDATVAQGNYSWQDGSTDPDFTATSGGIYWVDVSTGSCSERDSIVITDNSFSLDLGADRNLCSGAVTLDATITGATYQWQDGSTGSIYNVATAGQYWVDVTMGACTIRDSVLVEDGSFEVDLGNDTFICDNSILLDATTTDASYLWSNGSANASLNVSSGGIYWVDVTIGNCIDRDSIEITDRSFVVDIGEGGEICEASVVLDATTTAATYLWQDSSTSPTLTATTSGHYSVLVTRQDCDAVSSVDLEFIDCTVCDYHAPTAFSPNRDGFNDFFSLIFDCEPISFSIEIYNRWGERVFESDDPADSWDGTFNGVDSPMDVFTWFARYSDAVQEEKLIHGVVLIQR